MCLLDQWLTADAGADVDADALGIGFGNFEARITDCLDAGGHAELDEDIHAARFLGTEILLDVKTLHLASHMGGERRRFETGNPGDPGATGSQIVPGLRDGIADRGDNSQAGHDNTTLGQKSVLFIDPARYGCTPYH